MISSNSGSTSPDALMVFSMEPVSTTAVVIADFFKEERKEVRKNSTVVKIPATINSIIAIVFRFRLFIIDGEISVSTKFFRE